MKQLFVITITTKKDYSNTAGFFTEDGCVVGRLLDVHKVAVDQDNVYFSHDVETTEDTYKALKSGEKKLYRISEYTVEMCGTVYTRR